MDVETLYKDKITTTSMTKLLITLSKSTQHFKENMHIISSAIFGNYAQCMILNLVKIYSHEL